MKTLKIIAVVGAISFFALLGVLGWAAWGLVSQVSSWSLEQSPQEITAGLEPRVQELAGQIGNFAPFDCWQHAQTVMTSETWMTKPLKQQWQDLKVACLEPDPKSAPQQEAPKSST